MRATRRTRPGGRDEELRGSIGLLSGLVALVAISSASPPAPGIFEPACSASSSSPAAPASRCSPRVSPVASRCSCRCVAASVRHRGDGIVALAGSGAVAGHPSARCSPVLGSRSMATLTYVLALGVSSASVRRGPRSGSSSAGRSLLAPLAAGASNSLGILRDLLPGAAVMALSPEALASSRRSRCHPRPPPQASCSGRSLPLAAGAWRTRTRDA